MRTTLRNKILLLVSVTLFWACSDKNPAEQPTERGPVFSWLSTSGNRIVDDKGKSVILHGVNLPGLEWDLRGSGMTESDVIYICSEWKAKIIRIPFNQEWIVNDAEYRAFVDKVVGWIADNGAYVLLDLHWRNTAIKIPQIPDTGAVSMWRSVAERYKNNPAVLYDIHNEAHDTSWEAWRARACEIIDAIRAVHPRSLIFVSGLDWAYDLRGWDANPLPYANIVYSTHPYPFKAEPWAWDKYFGNAAATLPVFAGEFGGETADIPWGRQLIAYFDRKALGWTAWSWNASPFLVGDDRRTATPFGQVVRDALLQSAGADTQWVALKNIQVLYIDKDRATVNWETTVLSDSRVRYGATATYGDSAVAAALLKVHTIKLTGLGADTRYHFQVQSRDEAGHVAVSGDSTFVTLP